MSASVSSVRISRLAVVLLGAGLPPHDVAGERRPAVGVGRIPFRMDRPVSRYGQQAPRRSRRPLGHALGLGRPLPLPGVVARCGPHPVPGAVVEAGHGPAARRGLDHRDLAGGAVAAVVEPPLQPVLGHLVAAVVARGAPLDQQGSAAGPAPPASPVRPAGCAACPSPALTGAPPRRRCGPRPAPHSPTRSRDRARRRSGPAPVCRSAGSMPPRPPDANTPGSCGSGCRRRRAGPKRPTACRRGAPPAPSPAPPAPPPPTVAGRRRHHHRLRLRLRRLRLRRLRLRRRPPSTASSSGSVGPVSGSVSVGQGSMKRFRARLRNVAIWARVVCCRGQ